MLDKKLTTPPKYALDAAYVEAPPDHSILFTAVEWPMDLVPMNRIYQTERASGAVSF